MTTTSLHATFNRDHHPQYHSKLDTQHTSQARSITEGLTMHLEASPSRLLRPLSTPSTRHSHIKYTPATSHHTYIIIINQIYSHNTPLSGGHPLCEWENSKIPTFNSQFRTSLAPLWSENRDSDSPRCAPSIDIKTSTGCLSKNRAETFFVIISRTAALWTLPFGRRLAAKCGKDLAVGKEVKTHLLRSL